MTGPAMGLPFCDPTALCPKCGHGDVSMRFHASEHAPGCQYRSGKREPECCVSEHMDRCCRRCGFVWYESTLTTPTPVALPPGTRAADVLSALDGDG